MIDFKALDMPLYREVGGKLELVKEVKFALERDLQKIAEKNMETVFGLKVISSEFQLQNFRIDTLAFDEENKSFVVVEYKRGKSFSVVDQGYSYLSLMLNNKADFILEYNEKMKDNLKKDDVDWSQSRVVFVSNRFTNYQQTAINFKDLPIELWEAKKYDNDVVLFNQVKAASSSESIKTVSKNKTIESVSREVKTYSVDDHFKEGWDHSRELFDELRGRILELDERVVEKAVKSYIGYQIDGKVVVGIDVYKTGLRIGLNRVQPKDLRDPEKRVKYKKNSKKFYGKHISRFKVENMEDIDYAMSLIRQVYEKFFG